MTALSPVRKGMKCFYLHARTPKKDVFGLFLPYESMHIEALPSMEPCSSWARLLGLDLHVFMCHSQRFDSHLMKIQQHSPNFQNTRWSLVIDTRDEDGGKAHRALSELCEIYWYPIYAFIRRRGYTPTDAEDLTQDFFKDFLERKDFVKADPRKGRLRSYLLGALKHYLSNETARNEAQRRGGGMVAFALDVEWGESQLKLEPGSDHSTPEKLFDRRWALTLLNNALCNVRKSYTKRGKDKQFQTLEKFLTWNSGEDFREAAELIGMSESAFRVALHRLRQRYKKALRREVAETVGSEADLDQEITRLPSFFQ